LLPCSLRRFDASAITVPQAAVLQRNGQKIVFTVTDGRAQMHPVETGLSDATSIQITSGVQAGDTVILPGSITLADGVAVITSSGPPSAVEQPGAANGG